MPRYERVRGLAGGSDGAGIGVYAVSAGAAWDDLTVADFASVTSATLPTAGHLSDVVVLNTHATQTLFLLLRAGAATATSAAIPIPPLSTVRVECLRAADRAHVTALSIQGSGAATTGSIVATFVE